MAESRTGGRVFLHVDMDAFYASVEQHDHPELRGKPVIVGAQPTERGVVSAASYEARVFGVHSAMPSSEAGRLCPEGIFVPVNMRRYADLSRQIMAIFERFTPLVEPLSVDEAFLDVTGARALFGEGPEIGARIKQTVRDETGLTASVGVAPNKFLAKLASDLDKPDGLTVVPTSQEAIVAFLAPLSVRCIWGVGKVMSKTLSDAGIHTIAELQQTSEAQLSRVVGPHSARHLQRLAFGQDTREVELSREEKSISREHTFARDCRSKAKVRAVLIDLVEDVGCRLRKAGKHAGHVHLKLRWQGFKTITRQKALAQPSRDERSLREAALALFEQEKMVTAVRLVGFGVSDLSVPQATQLGLFDEPAAAGRDERLSDSVDKIRKALGPGSIRRASKL